MNTDTRKHLEEQMQHYLNMSERMWKTADDLVEKRMAEGDCPVAELVEVSPGEWEDPRQMRIDEVQAAAEYMEKAAEEIYKLLNSPESDPLERIADALERIADHIEASDDSNFMRELWSVTK